MHIMCRACDLLERVNRTLRGPTGFVPGTENHKTSYEREIVYICGARFRCCSMPLLAVLAVVSVYRCVWCVSHTLNVSRLRFFLCVTALTPGFVCAGSPCDR